MKRVWLLGALAACVAVPMAIIRPKDTSAEAGHHKARDQTESVMPSAERQQPIIVRPVDDKGPFILPHYVVPERVERAESTARQPGGIGF